mmetsp:Transcript_90352/g.260329  ORF Transcript_90352/g.260329 Transcript_90352/m.260329 type:complete len:226 (+) Transcript_90352:212-889(+)
MSCCRRQRQFAKTLVGAVLDICQRSTPVEAAPGSLHHPAQPWQHRVRQHRFTAVETGHAFGSLLGLRGDRLGVGLRGGTRLLPPARRLPRGRRPTTKAAREAVAVVELRRLVACLDLLPCATMQNRLLGIGDLPQLRLGEFVDPLPVLRIQFQRVRPICSRKHPHGASHKRSYRARTASGPRVDQRGNSQALSAGELLCPAIIFDFDARFSAEDEQAVRWLSARK